MSGTRGLVIEKLGESVGNELGKCEGTRLLDLDNPNREHFIGLGGSFPVFRSPCLSFFSFFSPVVGFSEGKPVDRCC